MRAWEGLEMNRLWIFQLSLWMSGIGWIANRVDPQGYRIWILKPRIDVNKTGARLAAGVDGVLLSQLEIAEKGAGAGA